LNCDAMDALVAAKAAMEASPLVSSFEIRTGQGTTTLEELQNVEWMAPEDMAAPAEPTPQPLEQSPAEEQQFATDVFDAEQLNAKADKSELFDLKMKMEVLEKRLEAKAHKETVKYMPAVLNARAKGPVADDDEDGVEVTETNQRQWSRPWSSRRHRRPGRPPRLPRRPRCSLAGSKRQRVPGKAPAPDL